MTTYQKVFVFVLGIAITYFPCFLFAAYIIDWLKISPASKAGPLIALGLSITVTLLTWKAVTDSKKPH
jgi:hypothetical protein